MNSIYVANNNIRLGAARSFVGHEPPKEDHNENAECDHITHVLGTARLEHSTDSFQTALQQIFRVLESVTHIIEQTILFADFVTNVDR